MSEIQGCQAATAAARRRGNLRTKTLKAFTEDPDRSILGAL